MNTPTDGNSPSEKEVERDDAERWRYVRDHGLVWLDPPFEGCTEGRVGDVYATRYIDHLLASNHRLSRPPLALGTRVPPWGKVIAVQWSGGERYYFLISKSGVVSYMPACVVEHWEDLP